MNSHQRRKRRRYCERLYRRVEEISKRVYGPLMGRLLDSTPLFHGAQFVAPEKQAT